MRVTDKLDAVYSLTTYSCPLFVFYLRLETAELRLAL